MHKKTSNLHSFFSLMSVILIDYVLLLLKCVSYEISRIHRCGAWINRYVNNCEIQI